MKIYTRSGDEGKTSLIHGRRVSKDSPRVEAYGTVDEANSAIGAALALMADVPELLNLVRFGRRVQRDLFDVGRDLATPEEKRDGFYIAQSDVDLLERMIDKLSEETPPLRQFVLPGGHPAAAWWHVARTVVRRAERQIVALEKVEPVQPMIRKYLNRLSDFLFVMARVVNARTGCAEPGVDFQADKPDPFGEV
ncbi:cob(I)yrinic acid a,c-diamide adenosyltransferase [Alicyclobacillus contaminans]|uniref:cob(I)yrinic acid a,c-diamide adenosyltransferase n=1 Tax=Alicyclobacillus contaminans TaxID=392016 RepID=UPI00040A836A|nr:cob(I)yrinic acid a,c-diamide adenosyltransferase [Alicyclobacillus contaminans]